MRRLLVVVCCVVAVDTMLSTALSPLLPSLTHRYGLSKAEVGMLVAAYYIGLVVVAAPTLRFAPGISARRATRDGVFLLGLGAVAFAFADSYATLVAARLLQGAGAMFCWSGASGWLVEATPVARRGYAIGLVAGVSSGGAVAGPVLGALSQTVGQTWTFSALGGFAALAGIGTGFLPTSAHDSITAPVGALLRARPVRDLGRALWLVSLPGALLGGLAVLGPLALSREGWSARGIAATYCAAAALGLVLRPLVGGLTDRHGRLAPLAVLLVVVVPFTLALNYERWPWLLSLGLVIAVTTSGAMWGPAMAILSDLCARFSISQTIAFVVALIAMSPCAAIGAFTAGAVSQVYGDITAYCLLAAICCATVAISSPVRRTLVVLAGVDR